MKTFHSKEEAERYALKNYFRGGYELKETNQGNFKIIKKIKKEMERI